MEKIIKTLKPNKADRDINIKKPKIEERKLNKEWYWFYFISQRWNDYFKISKT